jgi:hypothetical protein
MMDWKSKTRKTPKELLYYKERENLVASGARTKNNNFVLDNFPVYVSRQSLTRFLALQEIYLKVLALQGSIVECGVLSGFSLFTWAQLSSIYEPISGVSRRIYGFDTFSGFPSISTTDLDLLNDSSHQIGDLNENSDDFDTFENLRKASSLFDNNRFMAQFAKIEMIKGDFESTGPAFISEHPEILPCLLFLDFDLYEPTKLALELFVPLMPKGSIICFDELSDPTWPGETRAAREIINFANYEIRKSSFDTKLAYLVL